MSGQLTYAQKVLEISEVADKICTNWEYGFIESMMEKGPGEIYSDRCKKIIDELYKKACDSPY